MGKTRDLFKKIRDTKGTFRAKMGSIKDSNGMHLLEAEYSKKRWQEYKEELYKKDLHDPDNHDGVITHLEPDILECEVKQALRCITTNKASGGTEFQLSYLNSERMMLKSASLNMPANLENSTLTTGLDRFSFHSNLKKRQCQGMLKLLHNCTHFT